MELTEEQQRLLQQAEMIRMQQQQAEQEQERPSFFPTDPDYGKGDKPLVGIVGHGFVGKAVERSFNENIERFLVDPNYKTNIDQLIEQEPALCFVCTPTPVLNNGRIDAAVTIDAVLKLIRLTKSAVVLKSTVTPDVIDKICRSVEGAEAASRFIYSPEFLTEKNADHEFCNPEYMVLGGLPDSTQQLMEFYRSNTYMKFPNDPNKVTTCHPVEASFIKYAINTFLAMKVTFFNQLYKAMEDETLSVNPMEVIKALSHEPRLGPTHWRVPGPDNKRGFGGACFPKDLSAFVNYTDKMTLLESVQEINKELRSEYELDEREKVANVRFKEEDVEIVSNDIDEVLNEEDVLDTTGQIDMFEEEQEKSDV